MFYPLSSNSWGKEEALVFQRILEKGRFTMGESVKKFESSFADKIGIQISLHSLP
jgi:CDP-6-deoxy-D-xylo-4-hexulose-3-dehydrase